MKIERQRAELIEALLLHYDKQISEYAEDVSKVAELRAVKTLRDGVVQALQTLDVDGLTVNVSFVSFDVNQASVEVDENGVPKFKIVKSSDKRIPDRETTPIAFRFTDEEREAMKAFADRNDAKTSDVVRSALIYAGVISEQNDAA